MNEIRQKGGESSLNRAKIKMTGSGGAGKTSTVRSLKGETFIKEHISTIGVDASATCTVTRNDVGVDWSGVDLGTEALFVCCMKTFNVVNREK